MAPFIALVVSFFIFQVIGLMGISFLDTWQESLRGAVAVMFLVTASAHWGKRRADLIRMMPSKLPYKGFLVTITGVFEIIGAIGICFPSTAPYVSIGLTLMLIAMFPANIKAAREKLTIGDKPVPALLPRTLLQIIFIVAVLLAGWF